MTEADGALTAWVDAARSGGFPLPIRADRWAPLRAGVVNLWEFEETEYWYANGWVQLTGRNETGKSSLMALTTLIPWLADTASANIDTLGRSGKKFRYYVEPTGADGDRRSADGSTSRGWLWVEYGRLTDDGPTYFTTLQFAEARSAAAKLDLTWCTAEGRERVRESIHLAPGRDVATPKDLTAVIAHPDATSYRSHVADRLLGSSAERLQAVGKMLRETRTPKLGAQLQISFVQEYLRRALPALSRSEIDALAAGWDQLDQIRSDLHATRTAADTLARFTRGAWVPWVRAALRASADEAAAARSRLDEVTRDERTAQVALYEARDRSESLSEQVDQARREAEASREAARELQDSARFRDAQSRIQHLNGQRQKLASLEREHLGREQDVANGAAAVDREAADVQAGESQVTDQRTQVDRAADTFAVAVGEHLGPIGRPIDIAWAGQALTDRLDKVRAGQGLRKAADARESAAEHAEEVADRARDDARACADEAEQAWDRAQRERTATAAALSAWAHGVRPAITVEETDGWCAGLAATVGADGRIPGPRLAEVVRAAWFDPAQKTLLSAERDAQHRHATAVAELAELQSQIDELLAATTPTYPPPQLWQRRIRPASSDAGAALWSLLDPDPEAGPVELAGVEAALAASGLLDAWVSADGLYDPARDADDALIVVPPPTDGPSLSQVLRPARSAGALSGIVSGLLAAISYAPAGAAAGAADRMAVSGDGQWRSGALAGQAQTRHGRAEWIGEAARAERRQRRVAELTVAREAAQARLRGVLEELSQTAQALDALTADLATCPTDDGLRDLLSRAGHLDGVAEQAAAAAERATAAAAERRGQAAQALAVLLHSCSEARLPHTEEALRAAAEQIGAGQSALQEYRFALAKLAWFDEELARARKRAAIAAADLAQRRAALRKVTDDVHAVRVTVATLEAAAGADDQAILAELAALTAATSVAEVSREALEKQLREVIGTLEAARVVLHNTQTEREAAQGRRDLAYRSFRLHVDRGLDQELDLELPERTAASVERVREQVAATRREVEPKRWPADPDEQRRLLTSLISELAAKVGDTRAELEGNGRTMRLITDETGLARVEVTVDATGAPYGPKQAIAAIGQIHEELNRTYNEQVQQTLDELLGSTFLEHLRDRLGATDRLIDQINKVLAAHPVVTTSTSLSIKLVPASEAERTLVEAVRGPRLANPEVAARVRDHLRGRVERAKETAAREGDANWHDRLSEELDYRSWFDVNLRKKVGREGSWSPLTQRSFAEMSGGARAVMLMLPLVATLAAYYAEMPGAPRPLWLDEAFEGLDNANRATIMDLFHSFDLDVLLAGPARLVNVATVPAAAIYQVVRAPAPTPGVDLALELWAGGQLRVIELPINLPSGAPASTDEESGHQVVEPGMLL